MGTEIFLDYEAVFIGRQHAVGLKHRGKNDLHVCVQILTEDDENWFTSEGEFSSYWLLELTELMVEAHKWMSTNCEKDGAYSFKFKEGSKRINVRIGGL